MPEYTADGYRCVPTGSNGASVTSSASANVWSAWSELTPGLGSAILASGLWAWFNSSNRVNVQIGIGAAASEVAIAEMTIGGTISSEHGIVWLPLPIPIAAGTRIAWRMQHNQASAVTHYAKLVYIPGLPDTLSYTAAMPTPTAHVTVAPSATAWANGAWVEVIASTVSAIAIYSVALRTSLNTIGSQWEADIGVGASSSEVVVATLRWVNMQNFGNHHGQSVPMPLIDAVPASARVALRVRSNQGSTLSVFLGLNYYPLPL